MAVVSFGLWVTLAWLHRPLALAPTRPPGSAAAAGKSRSLSRRKAPELYDDDNRARAEQERVTSIAPTICIRTKPEVLAPAGGWPQLRAAVANGADAVYLGLDKYSARARAANFGVDELRDVTAFAHAKEVNVYVAVNTLAFESEFEELRQLLRACEAADVDAVIVQDLGLQRLIAREFPALPIHASTQQSISAADGAEFSRRHGASRVVVGRELSVAEIAEVVRGTSTQVEAFVHGALCVSWSGQCLSSEAWGGRSANRGQCAQACRLPYELRVEEEDSSSKKNHGRRRPRRQQEPTRGYFLSPQDLCGLDDVPALVEAGVSALKIEGRLKDERYVAATTRAYRTAVDSCFPTTSSSSEHTEDNKAVTRSDLAQVFARGQDAEHDGLSPGFLRGVDHQRLVRGRAPRHRGVLVGAVSSKRIDERHTWFELTPTAREDDHPANAEGGLLLKVGDGVVVDAADRAAPTNDGEFGGRVSAIDGRLVCVTRRPSSTTTTPGDAAKPPARGLLWRTSDAAVDAKLRGLARRVDDPSVKRDAVDVVIGNGRLTIRDARGNVGLAALNATGAFSDQEKTPFASSRAAAAVGSLGDTPWRLRSLAIADGAVSGKASEIKRARREAVAKLLAARRQSLLALRARRRRACRSATETTAFRSPSAAAASYPGGRRRDAIGVSLLVRTPAQLDGALRAAREHNNDKIFAVDEIVVDFLEIRGAAEAVARIRNDSSTVRVVVATPRVLLPGEHRIWRQLLATRPEALLVRSPGILEAVSRLAKELGVAVFGDASMNAANSASARTFFEAGLARLTAAHDLSGAAIAQLARDLGDEDASSSSEADSLPRHEVEAVAHAHLPVFHASHCVYARHLSGGSSYHDCGHPCTRATIRLRDAAGADHLVLADAGCRNTVFNAAAQSAARHLATWLDAGIRRYRLEFVDEDAATLRRVVDAYATLFERRGRAPEPLWSLLATLPDATGAAQGVGEGSLRDAPAGERPAGYVGRGPRAGAAASSSRGGRAPTASSKQKTKKKTPRQQQRSSPRRITPSNAGRR